MNYTIKSFQENGQEVEHAGQAASFFGLVVNGLVVDFFTTVQALTLAIETQRNLDCLDAEIEFSGSITLEVKIAA